MKKQISILLVLAVLFALALSGCGTAQTPAATQTDTPAAPAENNAPADQVKEDVITVLCPPSIPGYGDMVKAWGEEFAKTHPGVVVEAMETAWADLPDKLSTMALAGDAPDIGEMEYQVLGTYVDMDLVIPVRDYLSEERISDYYDYVLPYCMIDNTLYALPMGFGTHTLGGNRQMMIENGIDVDKIQTEGWTYEEFLDAVKKGTKDGVWGFVFANQGITTQDFVTIFGAVTGITSPFTQDLKYAFTSENMLQLLEIIQDLTSSGYMPNYTVAAAERLVMLERGECMITGKGLTVFETQVEANNAGIATGTAAEGSVEVHYAVLPVPHLEGVSPSTYAMSNVYAAFRNSKSDDEQHVKNVIEFMDYICSGDRAGQVSAYSQGTGPSACQSVADFLATQVFDTDPMNKICTAMNAANVVAPPEGISAEQSAIALQIMNEVIVPKMEGLIAGELSAQEVYDAIVSEAVAQFGADGCELGHIER